MPTGKKQSGSRKLRQQQKNAGPRDLTREGQIVRWTSLRLVLCVLLGVFTVSLYSSVGAHPSTNYDDPSYVFDNPHVKAGLSWATVAWAFRATEASNWHPVTWLSHAADWALFGANPSGHHWTSVVIHALNAMLLFLLLQRATGAKWRSLMVAALFALHPLNVESVAWISERKNVLSTLFLLLTLAAYGWYSQRPSVKRYGVVAGTFALGLMSKPMLVTLPVVLLLLDYWPLGRVEGIDPSGHFQRRSLRQLVLEKVPLVVMSIGSAVLTIVAQQSSLASTQRFPFGLRLENAVVSYILYLKKAVWPSPLALYYPHSERIAWWQWVGAAILLVSVSVVIWKQFRSKPYLLAGWCWFLAMLVPVLGIVQVGGQSMADRYAYVPLIGIFVAVVWLAAALPVGIARSTTAAAVLVALSVVTWRQIGYWKTNVDLWSHTLAATHNNLIAEDKMGSALQAAERQDEAMIHFTNALRLDPEDSLANFSIGADLQWRGRLSEAIPYYQEALRHTSDARLRADAYQNLATDYVQLGDAQQARENYIRALTANPALITALAGLGDLAGEPARSLSEAVVQNPTAEGFGELARAFQQAGRAQEAELAFAYAK